MDLKHPSRNAAGARLHPLATFLNLFSAVDSMSPTETRLGAAGPRRRARKAPAKLLGNWQLHQLIGQGSYTSVYTASPLGCPPAWPADYVVKILRNDHHQDELARRSLSREAEVGQACSHPNLLAILEDHHQDQPPHLVMPRLEGASLDHAIAKVGALAVPQALWLSRQVAQALHCLHRKGWLHGDVKPANVVVSREGHATLIDLALALRPREAYFDRDRRLAGTLAYIAPELLTSAHRARPTSDFYSLGIALFEMLSGRLPFNENDAGRLVEAHRTKAPPALDQLRNDLPSKVVDLVHELIAKSPLRRPQTGEELIDRLTELEIELMEQRLASSANAQESSLQADEKRTIATSPPAVRACD